MTILEKRTSQLTTILQAWNDLEKDDQEKSINFISEFILSASLLQKFSKDENLKTQLTLFQENYKKIFGVDITKLGTSDLSKESVEILKEIKKIDEKDLELSTKREQTTLLLKSKGLNPKEFREKLVAESSNKYPHAHIKVVQNYGDFIEYLDKNLTPEKREEFNRLKTTITSTEDQNEFFKNLVLLNNLSDIPTNFDKLKNQFGIDGIEEHTLINQGTQYRSYLDRQESIDRIFAQDDKAKNEEKDLYSLAQKYFLENGQQKSIKVDNKEILADFRSQELVKKTQTADSQSEENPLKISVGFEIETVLVAKGGFEAEKQRLENLSEFHQIIRSLADNNSRIKMRETYGFSGEGIGFTPNPLLLYSEESLDDLRSNHREKYGEKISEIEKFLEEEKLKHPQKTAIFDNAIKNIALLSQEEIFFLDLFYKRKEESKANRLAVDDIFDWRDSEQKHQEKFLGILQEIGEKGGFYAKTLDMIRASEFAIGEFPLESAQEKSLESLNYFRKVAGEHNLRAKDRSAQFNIGAEFEGETLKISTEKSEQDFGVSTNQLTIAVATTIKKALTRLLEDDPSLERKGQFVVGIELGVDRKKGLIEQTRGTPFVVIFDREHPQNSRGLTEDSSAFPIHRINTGKSGMMRLALIFGTEESTLVEDGKTTTTRSGEAVIETRLLGNNPHSAFFDGYPRVIFNGAEILTEKFITYLNDEFKSLSLEGIDVKARVAVDEKGRIESVPTTYPNPEKDASKPLVILSKSYPERH